MDKTSIDKTSVLDSAIKVSTINDLAGDWVNLKYLRSIQKTKSPKISQNVGQYSYISFNRDTATFVSNFHEWISFNIKSDGTNHFYCMRYDKDTIRMIVSNDKMTVIHNGINETYLKYQMCIPNDDWGTWLLNKEIFSGKYLNVDSLNHTVVFNDDGSVKGFLDFNSYEVMPNYYFAGSEFDILYMKKKPKDKFEYTWIFSNDTLKIYNLDCQEFDSINNMCVETKIGKLQYRLIKK